MKNPLFLLCILMCLSMGLLLSCEKSESYSPGGSVGIGGSLNKFTIIDSFLYIINDDHIECYDLDGSDIQFNSRTKVDVSIETVFPFDSLLLVGGQLGMYICQRSSSGSVEVISSYEHVQSCDPVVADDELAYVTLSSGCRNQSNQLDILDISDPFNPELLKSYPMTHPLGLGIDGKWLFICDSSAGLKVYDRNDPYDLRLEHHFDHLNPIDVIPYNGLLFVMTAQGIHQFTYSQNDIYEISSFGYQ